MVDRLLLYIDLLGFSVLVQTKKDILPDLFLALDKSVVHQHGAFKVIQFSDTLLVYNEPAVDSARDKSYCAMYLCEFAQEIQYRLLGHNAFLRGLITYGKFEDTGPPPSENYKHIRAFGGEALIKTYQTEKEIQAVGLFVDKTVKPYMNIFETHLYDEDQEIWFVDTATSLREKGFEGTDFSYAKEDAVTSGNECFLAYDLFYLKRLFECGHDTALLPTVRIKYLTTWEIYRQKYKGLCAALEETAFDFKKVIDIDWRPFVDTISTPGGYFG